MASRPQSPHPVSSVHKASLVDSALHDPATLQLIQLDISRNLIEHIVDTVVDTVDYALGRPTSSARGRTLSRHSEHVKFANFVAEVIYKAEIKTPSLLVTLVYIDRAKPHLQIALEQWACERVFLGALIVANKYTNDSTLKNIHWALCTGVFGKRDIGRIEREFLDVLDFTLGVSEADILAHYTPLMATAHPNHHVRAASPAPTRVHSRASSSSTRVPSCSGSSSSSDSMDLDSPSTSAESSTPPRTPVDIAAVVPAPKHSAPLGPAPQYVVLPSPTQAYVHQESAAHHRPHARSGDTQAPIPQRSVSLPQPQPQPHSHPRSHPHPHQQQQQQQQPPRRSAAMQLLQSLSFPHFHSHSSQSRSSRAAAASAAAPQPVSRRMSGVCRPPQIAMPSAAYAAPQVFV